MFRNPFKPVKWNSQTVYFWEWFYRKLSIFVNGSLPDDGKLTAKPNSLSEYLYSRHMYICAGMTCSQLEKRW